MPNKHCDKNLLKKLGQKNPFLNSEQNFFLKKKIDETKLHLIQIRLKLPNNFIFIFKGLATECIPTLFKNSI
jgi:hypothetical protein